MFLIIHEMEFGGDICSYATFAIQLFIFERVTINESYQRNVKVTDLNPMIHFFDLVRHQKFQNAI